MTCPLSDAERVVVAAQRGAGGRAARGGGAAGCGHGARGGGAAAAGYGRRRRCLRAYVRQPRTDV